MKPALKKYFYFCEASKKADVEQLQAFAVFAQCGTSRSSGAVEVNSVTHTGGHRQIHSFANRDYSPPLCFYDCFSALILNA